MDIKTVKKKLKAVIGKSRLLKSLIITLFAFPISYGLYYVLQDKLTYIGVDSSNLSYLKEYYKKRNQSESIYYDNHRAETQILIIPIKDSTPCDSIANLIDSLCIYQAKVIGLDYIFQSKSDNDSTIKKLKDVISQNSDKIVLAQAYDNNRRIIKSVFDGDSSLCFGLINSYGYDSIKCKRTIDQNEYSYFAYQIAKKYNGELFKDEDSVKLITNYSNIDIPFSGISHFMEEYKDDIKGKIVLIGVFNDVSDIHSTPYIIEGKEMMSGIMLLAYEIYSLISPDFVLKRLAIEYWKNVVLFFSLTFIYSLFYVLLTDRKNKYIERYYTALHIFRPIFLLFLVIALSFICYSITTNRHIIPYVVPFLISVFLINTFNGIFEIFINPNNK